MYTKQSLLLTYGTAWTKKKIQMECLMSQWDHTMAPKRASLSGLTFYVSLLKKLSETKLAFTEMTYGLAAFRTIARKIEQIKKSICKVFNSNHLQITIEANKKVVNFLDVTSDLNKQSYMPLAPSPTTSHFTYTAKASTYRLSLKTSRSL